MYVRFDGLAVAFAIGLLSCSPTTFSSSPTPLNKGVALTAQAAQVTRHGSTESITFKLDHNHFLRTQSASQSDLAFVTLSVTGTNMANTIRTEQVPVIGGTATVTLNNVPTGDGLLRVVTIQGYDSAKNSLGAFLGKGFYRSSSNLASIVLPLSRRRLLTGLVLENLLLNKPQQAATVDILALQSVTEQMTGFNAIAKTFVTDPVFFDPDKVAAQINGGTLPNSATLSTAAGFSAVTAGVSVKTPNNGNFAEPLTVVVDDPKSVAMTIARGTLSPTTVNVGNLGIGTFNIRVKQANGTLAALGSVTIKGDSSITFGTPTLNAVGTLESGTTTTVAGPLSNLATGYVNSPTSTNVRFNTPFGVTLDHTQTSLYIADGFNSAIRKVVIATGETTTVAGPVAPTVIDAYTNDPNPNNVRWNRPIALTLDNTDTNLYISDTSNHAIRKITLATGATTTVTGPLSNASGYVNDTTSTNVRFTYTAGIVLNSANTILYVTDQDNNAIRQVVLSTGATTTLAGPTTTLAGAYVNSSTSTSVRFNHPRGLAIDSTNTYLYLADQFNCAIRRITIATGETTTLAGPGTAICGYVNSTTAANVRFNSLQDLTIDSTNTYLYVADQSNNAVRRVTIATGETTTVAGPTAPATTNGYVNSVVAADVRFDFPIGIVLDRVNHVLYVVDQNNKAIRKVIP